MADALEAEFGALGDGVSPRHRAAVLVGEVTSMLLALAESEAPVPVVLVSAGAVPTEPAQHPAPRTDDMDNETTADTPRPRGVRFGSGTVVSPGEYRNCDTGAVRYFDGHTPLPGGVNSASWQQVSDHHHPSAEPAPAHDRPEAASHPVRFAAGTMVSPGEYRNCDTGAVNYFDGSSPLPGGANSASWQQVSDHYHPSGAPVQPEPRHTMPDTASRPVRFAAGTMVSAGEYRNCETGAVRYFDGNSPLPGGTNAASWQQVSDHQHPRVPDKA